jgi:hypothetical protein
MKQPTDFRPRALHAALLALLAALQLWMAPAALADAALPPLSRADGLGVNIHNTLIVPGQLEMIKAAGFKWIRMDLTWSVTEKQKGKYDFSAYDGLLAALDKAKLHALLVLDYGNPLYAELGDKQPFTSRAGTEEFRQAFAAWAAAAVGHFAGRGCIWEIWNEPNYKTFWAPAPNVDEYIALAKTACAAIRRVAPGEPLIGPGSSTIAFDFIEACCKAGLLGDWAAVSVHPYRRTDPATAADEFQRLRVLIAKYAPSGKTVEIISSEWGYSTSWKDFDETKQAAFLEREFQTDIASGIPLSIWYDWRDDGDSPADPEHRFGLVRRPYYPGRDPAYDAKPAFYTMKDFAAKLAAEYPPSSAAADQR